MALCSIFSSKFLSSVKCNYKIHDKKILVIIWDFEEWQYFLQKVVISMEIWIDYHNLEYFIIIKKLNHRQNWWLLYLARFNFILYYCSAKSMSELNIMLYWLDDRDGSYNNENVVLIKLEFLAVWVMEDLTFEGKESSILIDFQCSKWLGYQEELVARAARELY